MNNVVLTKPNERVESLTLSSSQSTKTYTVVGVFAWFFSALVAGWLGLFSQPGGPPTLLGLFVSAPILVFTALYLASAPFRNFAHSIPLPLIVGAHVWRYVGLGFVIAYFLGKLPPQFAFPEGLGDVLAAVFALPFARALYRGQPVRKWFVIWNVYGLVDLISAVTMGVLYSQGSFGIVRTGVSTALMTTFPINLIPTFFVPLFILLHLLALARRKEVGRPSEPSKGYIPVKRGSSIDAFADVRMGDSERSDDGTIGAKEKADFCAVLAAPGRAQEIPESADAYGWLAGNWELDVRHYGGG